MGGGNLEVLVDFHAMAAKLVGQDVSTIASALSDAHAAGIQADKAAKWGCTPTRIPIYERRKCQRCSQEFNSYIHVDKYNIRHGSVFCSDCFMKDYDLHVKIGKLRAALADQVVRTHEQSQQLKILNQTAHEKNLALDSQHYVWCDGGCTYGVHRFKENEATPLTEEIVATAERNTRRLRSWWENYRYKITNGKVPRWPEGTAEILVDPNPPPVITPIRTIDSQKAAGLCILGDACGAWCENKSVGKFKFGWSNTPLEACEKHSKHATKVE